MSIIPPYVPPFEPLPNITPFTYRNGVSYLQRLERLAKFVNDVAIFVNENTEHLGTVFEDEVNRLIGEINTALAGQNTAVDAKIAEFVTLINGKMVEINDALAQQNADNEAANSALTTYVNTTVTDLQTAVNAQIAAIVNESVEVQDDVVAAIINDTGSDTRAALNALFFNEDVNDPTIRALIENESSLTRTILDELYADKSIQETVETGRLSVTDLASTISTLIQDFDADDKTASYVSDPTSETREALDLRYQTIIPDNKWKAWRPVFGALAFGTGAFIDGRYYFDGVRIHVELTCQANPTTASGIVAAGANFPPPTLADISKGKVGLAGATQYDTFVNKIIGVGNAYDATGGTHHPIAVSLTADNTVNLYYWNGSTYSLWTASAPVTWGILDGFTVNFSYIPKVKTAPRSFTAYGDSITRFQGAPGIVPDHIGWTSQVVNAQGLVFGGGFAQDSATSAIVLANCAKTSTDFGICMVGVNDISGGVAQSVTLANIEAIANKVGADKFVVSKIAPYDANPTAANALNIAIENLANTKGWGLIDLFGAYRSGTGTWTAGASFDGTHPNAGPVTAAATIARNYINSH